VFVALPTHNWRQLAGEGRYSMKMAVVGPAGILGGVYLLLFPDKFGRPETRKDNVIVLGVFARGVLAGGYNWYLKDPAYFGR
jgi:hypothetical protein